MTVGRAWDTICTACVLVSKRWIHAISSTGTCPSKCNDVSHTLIYIRAITKALRTAGHHEFITESLNDTLQLAVLWCAACKHESALDCDPRPRRNHHLSRLGKLQCIKMHYHYTASVELS